MKQAKSFRLDEHTIYQIRKITERDNCTATEAVEKAIRVLRVAEMILDDEKLQKEHYITMLKALLEEG